MHNPRKTVGSWNGGHEIATGKATALDSGDLIPALLASSAIPGILPPVTIGGRQYIDGLASANLPARLAVERGAGSIVVLDTGSRKQGPVSKSPTKVVSPEWGLGREAHDFSGSPHLSGEQSLEVGWTADAETRAAEEGDALTYVDFTFP